MKSWCVTSVDFNVYLDLLQQTQSFVGYIVSAENSRCPLSVVLALIGEAVLRFDQFDVLVDALLIRQVLALSFQVVVVCLVVHGLTKGVR